MGVEGTVGERRAALRDENDADTEGVAGEKDVMVGQVNPIVVDEDTKLSLIIN